MRMGQLTVRRIIAAVKGKKVKEELALEPEVIVRRSSVKG